MEIVNYTQMKPGNTRHDSLVEIAKREAEVHFVYNPSYRAACYIELDYEGQNWKGRNVYAARVWRITDDGRDLLAKITCAPVSI